MDIIRRLCQTSARLCDASTFSSKRPPWITRRLRLWDLIPSPYCFFVSSRGWGLCLCVWQTKINTRSSRLSKNLSLPVKAIFGAEIDETHYLAYFFCLNCNWVNRYSRCLQILAMLSIYMPIAKSDCNRTPNSFADKTLSIPGNVVGKSRLLKWSLWKTACYIVTILQIVSIKIAFKYAMTLH